MLLIMAVVGVDDIEEFSNFVFEVVSFCLGVV